MCGSIVGRVLEDRLNDEAKLLSCIYIVEMSVMITPRSVVHVVGMT